MSEGSEDSTRRMTSVSDSLLTSYPGDGHITSWRIEVGEAVLEHLENDPDSKRPL